jgi:glyoxylase-like metal-dependent hydrolase (beta-lactamase superfamily II)
VVMTHLDGDHGGGLPDFPRAEVHVSRREHEVMMRPPRRASPTGPTAPAGFCTTSPANSGLASRACA